MMKRIPFFDRLKVSRETIESIKRYMNLLIEWNSKVNLVSKNSINDIWKRHILDSAQLINFVDFGTKKWVDLGSGAGFPGLIIASLAKDKYPHLSVSLVESNKRKCVFLGQAAQILKVNVDIYPVRIQDCSFEDVDIVSARALAPIKELIPYINLFGNKNCKGLFLKGKNIFEELKAIKDIDSFKIKVNPSLVGSTGCILEIEKRKG